MTNNVIRCYQIPNSKFYDHLDFTDNDNPAILLASTHSFLPILETLYKQSDSLN